MESVLGAVWRLVPASMVFVLTVIVTVVVLALLPAGFTRWIPMWGVVAFGVVMAAGYYALLRDGDASSSTYGDARFATLPEDAGRLGEMTGGNGVFFGDMVLASKKPHQPMHYSGPRHMVTVAPNRTGKGTCAIIPNLLTLNRSVICIDPKGQNAAVTLRRRKAFGPVFLLNPFNEHRLGTHGFNPLAHLTLDSPNLTADIASIAEALIVSDGDDKPHFPNSARDLVSVIMLHLIATDKKNATLPKMRQLLTLNGDQFIDFLAEMAKSEHSFIANPSGRFIRDSDEIASVISTAITQTRFLDDPAIAKVLGTSDFRMRDFKDGVATLFIILPARFLAPYARFFRLLVVSAIDQLTSRPGGTKTVLMLDEFAQLGHLSSVETAFGLAAGYNLQLWPFLQDLNQLTHIYKERWQSLLANAGVVQWFTPNDAFTAEYLSKRCGNKTITTTSHSSNTGQGNTSSGTNQSETGVPLVTPQDLYGMGESASIITLSSLQYPVLALRAPYFRQSGLSGLYDADPFHG